MKERFLELANEWMELAAKPVMHERKQIWCALNAIKPIRPAILVETCLMTDYVQESELTSKDAYLRGIEKLMLENIRHARDIGDDFVLEPFLRIPWAVDKGNFGVPIESITATDSFGDSVACTFVHPIKTIDDLSLLKAAQFSCDSDATLQRANILRDAFGDILPVKIGGIDPVYGADGYSPFCGLLITEITLNLFKLVGMENIYFWLYDEPEKLKQLMDFLTEDFINFHRYLEQNSLLANNSDYSLTGGRYGYDNSAPLIDDADIKLSDSWIWCNAEETTSISTQMYEEFIFPCLKRAMQDFGKVYFGCCENIESRWELIKSLDRLKAVSISPFSDVRQMSELLDGKYILSRKPQPAFLALPNPDWDAIAKETKDLAACCKNGKYEIIMRDVYRTHGNKDVLREWVNLVKKIVI